VLNGGLRSGRATFNIETNTETTVTKTTKKTTKRRTPRRPRPYIPAENYIGTDGKPALKVHEAHDLPPGWYSEEVHAWVEELELPDDVRRDVELHLCIRRKGWHDPSEPNNPRTKKVIRAFNNLVKKADTGGIREYLLTPEASTLIELSKPKERPRKRRAASEFAYNSFPFWTRYFEQYFPLDVAEARAHEAIMLEVGKVPYGRTDEEQARAQRIAGKRQRPPKSLRPVETVVGSFRKLFERDSVAKLIANAKGDPAACKRLATELGAKAGLNDQQTGKLYRLLRSGKANSKNLSELWASFDDPRSLRTLRKK
jgi:hypothetical protein